MAVFHAGERLQYKVKWLFFRIGTIIVETDSIPGNPSLLRASIALDSNPDIFFVDLHNRYEAIVNTDPLRCERFRAHERVGDDTLITTYEFDESLSRVSMQQRILPADTLIKAGVMDSVELFFDGSSLFFLARTMLRSGSRESIPTMVDFNLFTTDITFTNRIVPRTINAVAWPVRTRELFGRANFEGKTFAGFSGEFRGWFSDDDAAIPIQAEMNIWLGSVDIELEQWRRRLWQPPPTTER